MQTAADQKSLVEALTASAAQRGISKTRLARMMAASDQPGNPEQKLTRAVNARAALERRAENAVTKAVKAHADLHAFFGDSKDCDPLESCAYSSPTGKGRLPHPLRAHAAFCKALSVWSALQASSSFAALARPTTLDGSPTGEQALGEIVTTLYDDVGLEFRDIALLRLAHRRKKLPIQEDHWRSETRAVKTAYYEWRKPS